MEYKREEQIKLIDARFALMVVIKNWRGKTVFESGILDAQGYLDFAGETKFNYAHRIMNVTGFMDVWIDNDAFELKCFSK